MDQERTRSLLLVRKGGKTKTPCQSLRTHSSNPRFKSSTSTPTASTQVDPDVSPRAVLENKLEAELKLTALLRGRLISGFEIGQTTD